MFSLVMRHMNPGLQFTRAASVGRLRQVPAATAEVVHQMRSNMVARISGLLGWRDYVGTTPNQILAGAGAGMTWWLNRYFAIDGGVTYQRTFNDGGTEEDDLFVGVGVKMQR